MAAAAAAAAILLALPSTFWVCVGESLAASAFSVCNISTGFRDAAGQSDRMEPKSRCQFYEIDRFWTVRIFYSFGTAPKAGKMIDRARVRNGNTAI